MRVAVALMALVLALPAAAHQLLVQANDRKWNGQVWDGAEVYSPIAAPTNTPPDLGVCVVPVSGGLSGILCQGPVWVRKGFEIYT
jgi:hypothetical protein